MGAELTPGSVEDRPLLSVRDVSLRFGGVKALDGVSFDVAPGERVAIIGPNGAGKTSVFNVISRSYVADQGSVQFLGHELRSVPAHRIAALGISRTFQNIAVFPSLTVLENVALGRLGRERPSWLSTILGGRRASALHRSTLDAAREALIRLDMAEYAHRKPVQLPQGVLRQIEVARALVAQPRLLLLDEPAAGLNASELTRLASAIRRVNEEDGIAVLLIEHRMDFVMPLAHRVLVLDFGHVIASGTPQGIQNDERALAAYLGDLDE